MKKLFFILAAFFITMPLWADIAPQPQITYKFNFVDTAPVDIDPAKSEEFQCADTTCLTPVPLGKYGMQKLTCAKDYCYSVLYQFEPFQKLIIGFTDGSVKETQVFTSPSKIRNTVQINVGKNGLTATVLPDTKAQDHLPKSYTLTAFSITMILELLTAFIYLFIGGLSLSVLFYVAAANLITIPVNWFILSNYLPNQALLWVAAFVFELLFIYFLNKKRLTFKDSFGLTLTVNITSFALGMMLMYLLATI
ncbi:MAG: hypothetical protein LBM71_03790 [Elusimicrobiota bacterium]|jgi:hypothetical protein|nr:hypothetical protein [Elusimicrobiota bacterium]